MTPKIIHYVWVGDAPKPPIVQKCIESWKKFCPGWEIREWGGESLTGVDCRYPHEALEHRKWAFVSDYLRLKVLSEHGGFYFDTDLELLKPIDEFLSNDFTTGFIDGKSTVYLNMCFIGAAPGNRIVTEMLDQYSSLRFVKPDGELDQTPNVVRFANYFQTRGFDFSCARATVEISRNEKIYPVEYFNSLSGYAYHHLAASWVDSWVRKVWLKFGQYKLVRFKRRLRAKNSPLNLLPNERVLFKIGFGERKILCLTIID